MQSKEFYALCLAYIVGLLVTGIDATIYGIPAGAIALIICSIISALLLPRLWHTAPKTGYWLLAGTIALVGCGHLYLRTPTPSLNDLSRWQQRIHPDAVVTVYGQIVDEPQLNRNQKVRFLLKVSQLKVQAGTNTFAVDEPVTGSVYTTVGILQGTGHYSGEWVDVQGTLYLPNTAQNPGGFDFRAHLAKQGVFSGLRGERITHIAGAPSLMWRMRQRVVRGLVRHLGTPEGTLLSAMVLGRRAVDLPYDVRDAFTQAGLAHTIAASGFHVSLLLSVVMIGARQMSPQTQCWLGSGVLLLYVGLTGAQASVIRAGLMGAAALLGSVMERRSKPVPLLLLIATVMLIWNPLWIWDLGFQFSFLATLGLLVLVPALIQRLNWMPTRIATLVAVPMAAYIWVMPIQMKVFGSTPTYSIGLNVLATPLILLISLGGMVCGAIALFVPSLGGLLAWCLQLPISGLIELVNVWNQLPGSTVMTGSLGIIPVVLIYGIYGVIGWTSHWQRRWWLGALLVAVLITAPVAYSSVQSPSVTVLATSRGPALVVRDRNTTGLIFSGTDAEATYTVLPFLRSQGIGRLNWAIAPTLSGNDTGWPRIVETLSVQRLYHQAANSIFAEESTTQQSAARSVSTTSSSTIAEASSGEPDWLSQSVTHLAIEPGQQIHGGRIPIQFLADYPMILRFQMGEFRWMICDRQQTTAPAPSYAPETADIVWWSGDEIDAPWIEALLPKVAIAPTLNGDIRTHGTAPNTATPLISAYQTNESGALQWTADNGFIQFTVNQEPY